MSSNEKCNHQTVLITGASGGIGYELSLLFAQRGYQLVLVARNTERLAKMAKDLETQYPCTVVPLTKDLSEIMAPAEIAAELKKRKIQIDILVNNAGFGNLETFAEGHWETQRQMMQLNMTSLVELTRHFLAGMLERKFGKILNVGSTGSFAPVPYMAIYAATKAFVLSFSEALSGELKGSGVSITALCPGVTKTQFHQRAHTLDTMLVHINQMSAKAVAAAGFKGLMRGKTLIIPGLYNQLMIGSLRLAPRDGVVAMSQWMMRGKT